MKKFLTTLFTLYILFMVGYAIAEDPAKNQKNIGALYPQQALNYMKQTKNLVIIDVSSQRHHESKHFVNSLDVPIENYEEDEIKAIFKKVIPKNRPVLLHCRQGIIVPSAYKLLEEARPDVPEISYISGKPLFDEYNEWIEHNRP